MPVIYFPAPCFIVLCGCWASSKYLRDIFPNSYFLLSCVCVIFGNSQNISNGSIILCSLWWSVGLPKWFSGKECTCQCRRYRRHGFDTWVGKIPWRRKWQPTPVFLPEKSHGQRSLVVTAHESDIAQQPSTHTMVICEQRSSKLLTLINIILWLFWGFTNCHSIRWIAKSINNEISVLTAPPTSFPPISHPLLGLPYSLKYSNMGTRPVNISNNDRKYVGKKIKTNIVLKIQKKNRARNN